MLHHAKKDERKPKTYQWRLLQQSSFLKILKDHSYAKVEDVRSFLLPFAVLQNNK